MNKYFDLLLKLINFFNFSLEKEMQNHNKIIISS
jgi:hypothetical protein